MTLGFEHTFEGGDANHPGTLTDSYIAVINADAQSYTSETLWIEDGKLCVGDRFRVTGLTGVDYLVLHMRTTTTPPNWREFPSIKTPFAEAETALGKGDTTNAENYVKAAVIAAMQCPDLTRTDAIAAANALWQDWKNVQGAITGNLAGASRSVTGSPPVQAMRQLPQIDNNERAGSLLGIPRSQGRSTLRKLADMPLKPPAPPVLPQTPEELFRS